jgi:hypothetical protein
LLSLALGYKYDPENARFAEVGVLRLPTADLCQKTHESGLYRPDFA